MKTVFKTLPEKAVILAVMILSFKDSKTSHSFTIVSVLLLHVKLTTTVFSPMYVTLSCKPQTPTRYYLVMLDYYIKQIYVMLLEGQLYSEI